MRSIVITGATSGIGLNLTRKLAKEDNKIIMACRNIDKGEALRQEIIKESNNKEIYLEYLDLEVNESINNIRKIIEKKYGKVDIWVNNAGVFCERHEEVNKIEKTMYINFYQTKKLAENILPLMNSDGKIINVASKAGMYGDLSQNVVTNKKLKSFPAYAASKLALIIYGENLAKELKEKSSVKVYSIHPGHVFTNIWGGQTFTMRLAYPLMKLFSKKSQDGTKAILNVINNDYKPGFYGDKGKIELTEKQIGKIVLEKYNKLL